MGGFSKSLINFLLCADAYPELDITVVTLQENEIDDYKEIPLRFEYIALNGLDYREKPRRGFNKDYLFDWQRLRNVEYVATETVCKALKRPLPTRTVVKFMSLSEADRAARVTPDLSFCSEFDVVISWEEVFCNYLLAQRMTAPVRIGYIHPNYNEVGFSRVVDKRYLKQLDAIVTISDSCCVTLCKVFPELKEKIFYVPNRVNLSRLNALAQEYVPSMCSADFNIVTACRISNHDKAVFRIVELAERLGDPGIRFKWFVIGDGSDYEELQRRICDAGLAEVVICVGQLDNPLPYMKNASLYVQQSYIEGRPVSVDEAYLLGTPVLVTNYSSAREQVKHGKTGWICDNNVDAIYDQLRTILNNPGMLDETRQYIAKQDKSCFEDCTAMIDMLYMVCDKKKGLAG